jgi:DNA polymerase III delta subunit
MNRDQIMSELKMKAFPVRKLMEQAALIGADGIGRRLSVLAETDARMKGMGSLPADMELQLCIGRLLAE